MTLLAMLRHGETPWTAERRIQGRTDLPLSQEGRARLEQRAVPQECMGMRCVSSPLRRCTETALCLQLPAVELEPRIAEMSWGEWEGRRLQDVRAELGDAMRDNEARGFDFMPPRGESPRQVLARVAPWLVAVASEGRPTMAVSHRGVIRAIFASACGWDMLGKPPFKLDWSCLQLFRIDATGRATVVRLNIALAQRTPGAPTP